MNRAVLVTGASTGIGRSCALDLDRRGYRVFAGVRKAEDGERLKSEATGRLDPIRLDVTEDGDIKEAAQILEESGVPLAGLVNNAGVVIAGPAEFISLDDLRRQLEVNFIGQVAVTQPLIGLLRKAGGRIVNIGSIGGRFANPYVMPYCASKFAMEAFTDALRHELRPWGINVSIVDPGSIATPLWEKSIDEALRRRASLDPKAEDLYGEEMDVAVRVSRDLGKKGIGPEAVAKAVVHALESRRPKTRYYVGPDAKIQALILRLTTDRLRDRLVRMQLRR